MSLILAKNIEALMQASCDLRTQAKLGKAAGIDQRTVGRILKAEHSPSMDKVQAIADAFGIMPWQLLVPDLDPKNLPACDLTSVEVELYKKLRSLVTTLPPNDAPK